MNAHAPLSITTFTNYRVSFFDVNLRAQSLEIKFLPTLGHEPSVIEISSTAK